MPCPMRKQSQAYMYGLATVLLWSTVASAFKLSLRTLDVVELLFFSSLVSTAVLFVFVVLQKKLILLRTVTQKILAQSLLLGLLNPFSYYLILFKAYDLLPAQQAQPLNYTWAITLSLLSVPLLGQRLRPIDLLALFVSYAGVIVISTGGNVSALTMTSPLGVGLALFSTVVWALYWIANTRDRFDPVVRLFLNFVFGTVYTAAAWWFSRKTHTLPAWSMLPGPLYIGVFEMGVTFVLWLKALKLSQSTAKVSNLIFLSPFLSLVLIHFLVGEVILPSTLTGLILIVGGILMQRIGTSRVPTEPKPRG
ncbi:MAG: DMT family transporter [Desulfovibrionales bacterium]